MNFPSVFNNGFLKRQAKARIATTRKNKPCEFGLLKMSKFWIMEFRSGPMRRRLDELRQVRKEAAVIARVVCCGVPDLFVSL